MKVALTISERSVDPKHKVGVIVVSDDNTQLLALGYNGNYKGGPNTVESFQPGESGLLYAEINALLKLDYNNPKRKKMYVTLSPCAMCAKAIVNSGIDEVVYLDEYRETTGLHVLDSAKIINRQFMFT
jgi:dCMP deaminase